MHRVMLLACLWLFFCLALNAKPLYIITGKVIDSEDKPLPFANISLHLKKDSSLIKATACDEMGSFTLELEPKSEQLYFLKVSMVFFQPLIQEIAPLSNAKTDIDLGIIRLETKQQVLNEVQVSGKKPFIERKSDRYVVNVESSILASGSSAFEVLQKAPGVTINYLDAITMKGKSGVLIMIDGKPTPMSGSDLGNYLKALPSNSLDRIEIITNPPAKYDAAGNAGIIDIKMKKDQRFGTNGNLSANYGQGVYPKTGVGLNLNHREKNFNIFGNANYSYRQGLNKLNLYREFFENQSRTGAYDQQNYLVFPFNFYLAKLGSDFYLPNGKTVVGFVATGSLNRFKPNGQNNSDVEDESGQKVSSFSTSNHSKDVWPNYSINLNAKHSFDSAGTELNIDLDYARFENNTEQNFLTKYFDVQHQPLAPDYYLYGDLKGKLKIRSLKMDFSKNLNHQGKLEAGIKSSMVDADNDLAFFDKSNPVPVYDSTKSNHFIYKENINAAYINLQQEWQKFSLQAGFRVEQTIAKGNQLVNGQSFDKNYVNLFPSLFINYAVSPQYNMGINVSRRLDRPNYEQLNPFKFFLDPSTYKEGNPYLNPQYSWNFEWNHNFNKNYNLSFTYSSTEDNITEVIGPVEGQNRITVQTNENLTRFENYSISGSVHFDILKNWSSMLNVNSWIGKYKGEFANTHLSDGNLVLELSSTNSFKFENDWAGELNFSYQTPQVYGFMHLNTMWGLGLGIQKQVFQKKLSLKLSATDIFWTNLPSASIYYRDYFERFDVKRETRVLSLSVNYKFGSTKISGGRKRTSGAEEEKKRASAGGN